MTRADATRTDLRAHLRRVPFQPFAINLESGDRIIIHHPENIAYDPTNNGSQRAAIVCGELGHYTNLSAITSISLIDRGEATL
jgi:hypothetical protein